MPVLENRKHEIFAQEMAKPGSSTIPSLTKAGYAPHPAAATRLLKNVNISARIAEIQNRGAERAAASVERIVEEIERLSFSDLTEAIDIRRNKIYLKDIKKLPKEVRAAIASLKQTKEGIEVKFYNKIAALDMLAKHRGMFRENIDLHVTVSLLDLVNASYPAPAEPAKVIEHEPDENRE